MANTVYLDIFMGDEEKHGQQESSFLHTQQLICKHAKAYGFPPDCTPDQLSEEQRDIIKDLDKSNALCFESPTPLCIGRMVFELNSSPSLSKTTTNFVALCTGEKGACKNAQSKRLHYLKCPMHRIVKGYIAQGGDITRGDGSGGESIYGGKFNDAKEGLNTTIRKGSLAMANSGKNSNTSQFFVVLTDDSEQIKKIKGRYVVFGELKAGWEVLQRLDEVGGADGKTCVPVWIGGCGTC